VVPEGAAASFLKQAGAEAAAEEGRARRGTKAEEPRPVFPFPHSGRESLRVVVHDLQGAEAAGEGDLFVSLSLPPLKAKKTKLRSKCVEAAWHETFLL
jgi:hypothetical protein